MSSEGKIGDGMKHEVTAKRLTFALERKGIIAQELADLSGIHKSSISQYVNGTHAPSNISAGKMGEVLQVSPVWLMGFDVPMFETQKKPGEMGRMAEMESIYLQEAAQYFDSLNEENRKKAISYMEKLYAIQTAEAEVK